MIVRTQDQKTRQEVQVAIIFLDLMHKLLPPGDVPEQCKLHVEQGILQEWYLEPVCNFVIEAADVLDSLIERVDSLCWMQALLWPVSRGHEALEVRRAPRELGSRGVGLTSMAGYSWRDNSIMQLGVR